MDEVKGKKPGSFLQGEETNQRSVNVIRQKIKNREAKSILFSINIETFYKTEKLIFIDIKYGLLQEFVLKKKNKQQKEL